MKHIIRHILWAIPLLLLSCAAPKTGGKGAAAPAPVDPQVRSIFLDANREKVLGNSAEAEKLFRMVVDREPNNAAAHYELARLLHRSGRESEALEAARTASGLDPQNVWYTLYLAELYEDAGMPEKAVQLIEDLTQRYPDQEEYHEMLAGGYILLGRHADAIRTLDLMERKFGKNEDLLMQKRELYLQDGKFDKAMEETRKLSELSSRDTRYLLMMAEMHMDRGNKEEALALYRRVQDIDPGDPYIHMSLADYYRKAGDNEASFRELMLGMGNPRLDIDTKVQVLLSFYAVGELYDTLPKQGIALSGVLTRAHPDDPKSHSILADFLGRDGQYPGARESLMRVVELDSSKYIIWEQLLRIELQLKEYASMSSHARRATALFPNMPILYLLGGVAQYNRKEYTAAARSFELGLKLVVGDPRLKSDFHTYLGDTYQELGDYPNSTRNYQQALDIDPNNIYVLNNYSYFLSLRKDDLERAAQMAGRANELEPGNASYQDTYGWVLYVMGDYSGARTWLEKALASGGSDNAVILEHYADVLYKLGDIPGAREYWKKAAEKGKGSDLLQKKLRDGLLYE